MPEEIRLTSQTSQPIKALKGFSKGGRVPNSASAGDVRYVTQLAKSDLEADLDRTFAALRKAFSFKRKQLQVAEPEEGIGVISTPEFNYEVSLSLEEDSPGKVQWRRCVGGIENPQAILTDDFVAAFNAAFNEDLGHLFSTLEVTVEQALNVEAIIDCVEDADADSVKIDYDKDTTWCEITLSDSATSVRVEADSICVSSRGEVSPAELIEAFVDVQRRFLQTLGLE